MLILARKRGEEITVETSDGPLKLVVLEVRETGLVRIGFDAPPQVRIWRSELLAGRDAEQSQSQSQSGEGR